VGGYARGGKRGEGSYGEVFSAQEETTGHARALKRVRMEKEKEGFPLTALREIALLRRLRHPHIVSLIDVAVGPRPDRVFLVFEYCDHDLASLLDSSPSPPFSEGEVKRLLLQLLDAVAFMHEQWVLHRDIKMSNLLYSHGSLKLCDLGLAREFGTPLVPYTPKVVTLWYRAPELLLGAKTYSSAIDLWACGGIMGELLLHAPILPGRNEREQLLLTYELLGSPNETIWPGYSSLPHLALFSIPHQPYNNISQRFPSLSSAGRELLNSLLTYDPDKRPSAREAIKHDYFRERPIPKCVDAMPSFPSPSRQEGRKRPRSGGDAENSKAKEKGARLGMLF